MNNDQQPHNQFSSPFVAATNKMEIDDDLIEENTTLNSYNFNDTKSDTKYKLGDEGKCIDSMASDVTPSCILTHMEQTQSICIQDSYMNELINDTHIDGNTDVSDDRVVDISLIKYQEAPRNIRCKVQKGEKYLRSYQQCRPVYGAKIHEVTICCNSDKQDSNTVRIPLSIYKEARMNYINKSMPEKDVIENTFLQLCATHEDIEKQYKGVYESVIQSRSNDDYHSFFGY